MLGALKKLLGLEPRRVTYYPNARDLRTIEQVRSDARPWFENVELHPLEKRYWLIVHRQGGVTERDEIESLLQDAHEVLGMLPELVPILRKSTPANISIVAIHPASQFWAAAEDYKSLEKFKSLLPILPEGYARCVRDAFEDAKIAEGVRTLIQSSPGTLQKDVPKLLQVPGRKTSIVISRMERLGRIEREPHKQTYKLHFVEP